MQECSWCEGFLPETEESNNRERGGVLGGVFLTWLWIG